MPRLRIVAATAALVVGLTCSCSSTARHVAAGTGSPSTTVPSTSTAAPTPRPGQPCTQVTTRLGGSALPALSTTGHHKILFTIENDGPVSCTVIGYPAVSLSDAHAHVLTFRYTNGQSRFLTSKPPKLVTLGPGGVAYVMIVKYYCNEGRLADVTSAQLTFAQSDLRLTTTVDTTADPFGYCHGGAADPGQLIAVSPVEPNGTDVGPP